MPEPTPITKRPKVEIIEDNDPVLSWRKTKPRLVELLSGDVGKAEDRLWASQNIDEARNADLRSKRDNGYGKTPADNQQQLDWAHTHNGSPTCKSGGSCTR